jgi:tetratricopeptide (TPR) repeat protein
VLLRRKRYEDLRTLMKNQGENHRTYTYYMLAATAIRNTKEPMDSKARLESILESYRNALSLNPFAEKAMQGEARTLLEMERYEEAIATYDHLIAINPDKQSYVLNRAVCLESLERYEEALKPLFRLNYEQPDDVNVSRVLAWTLLGVGKYEQAFTLYEKLTTVEQAAAEDFLNQGYCLWLAGNVQGAIDSFRHYLKETGEPAFNIINNEERMLSKKGISNEEMQMMYDAIAS